MKPAAGIVGLVSKPLEGLWKAAQTPMARSQEAQLRGTRVSDGTAAVQRSTHTQRSEILRKFKEAKLVTKERQKQYREMAEKAMYGEGDPSHQDASSAIASSSTQPVPTEPAAEDEDAEDAKYQRDLDIAVQMSLAEQRGYEYGLATANKAGRDSSL